MRILGLIGDGMNPGACLVADGEIVAMIEEERITRYKSSHGFFPARSARACMEIGGFETLDDIDAVAWGWNARKYPGRMARFFLTAYLRNVGKTRRPLRSGPVRGVGPASQVLRQLFRERPAYREERLHTQMRGVGLSGRMPPLHFFDHHLCHAASAYYLSGFEDAAVLTIDGSGEEVCTTISRGRGSSIEVLESIPIPNSLGWYYAAFSEILGFTPYRDEGKVMGLAAYGEPVERWSDVVHEVLTCHSDGNYEVAPRYTLLGHHYHANHASDELVELCGGLRRRGEPLEARHRHLAFAVQEGLERAALGLARRAMNVAGSRNLCLAGGVALNCKMNGVLRRESGCERLFVQPAANDSGAALGAALLLSHFSGQPIQQEIEHTHYGPGYSNDDIRATLETCQLEYSAPDDVVDRAADMISDDRIVGWFQGRMEFGPRALGGRSILANARTPEMADKVNRLVKFREPWRPFCPSMSRGEEELWLEDGEKAPFMIVAYQSKDGWKEKLPSVVHVDGSVRPQTVSGTIGDGDDRPANRYRQLIDAVGDRTGSRVVLNTSFNVRGEPIVCSPLDAVRCFMGTGMEALVIGDYLLTKPGVR